jgi:hypothetical protein
MTRFRGDVSLTLWIAVIGAIAVAIYEAFRWLLS